MGAVVSLTFVAGILSIQLLIILLIWKFIRGVLVRVIRDGIVAARDYDGPPNHNVPKGLSHNPDRVTYHKRDGKVVRKDSNGVNVLSDDEVRALKARWNARNNKKGK